ncbi:RTA-like protein [Suillus paluster]|uniref:RTA-like protein n=1 Tax=Suillus paluster TaxID=48578 RepID=UPI001B86671F|nr:RTA-like protein [Suillus paluster]KAG1741867.1 RTA-like protein [Suillus paluster]
MGQALKYRLWWMLPTATFAGVMEIFGWSARFWSSQSPKLTQAFHCRLVGTIIAPTPLVAANFIVLGKTITQVGPQFSRLTPKMYTILFCSFDVICLVVQAFGGASPAHAVNQGTSAKKMCISSSISCAIVVYVTLAVEFLLHLRNKAPFRHVDNRMSEKGQRPINKNLQLMIFGVEFCIFIRSVYRTVELANGWTGTVITTQRYFDWLDGALVTLAIYTLNVMHPGI